jgi:lysophospholipase L1-like esterase
MPGRNAYYAESFAAMRGALAALASDREDFHWFDATGAFSGMTEVAYVDDCHLTPDGQRRLAERIADAWLALAEP